MNPSSTPDPTLLDLRRQYNQVSMIYALVILGCFLGLQLIWVDSTRIWLLMNSLAATIVLWILKRGLKDNRRPGESELFPTLGLANRISLFRGLLLCLTAGFVFSPHPIGLLAWAPALFYTTAILLDMVDGYAARRTDQPTVLGETLDIELDGLGALIATLLGVQYGNLPIWFIGLAPLRQLFIFGINWRKNRGLPVYDMHDSIYRRLVAGVQMGVIGAMVWPIVHPPATTIAAVMVAVAVLASFGRDWLVVIGRLDPASPAYWDRKERLKTALTVWLPVGLRLIVAVATVTLLMAVVSGSQSIANFAWPVGPFVQFTGVILFALVVITAAMLLFGIAGRAAAWALSIAIAPHILNSGLTPANGLILAVAIYMILSGSGAFSIWEPERRFFTQRLGRKGEESK